MTDPRENKNVFPKKRELSEVMTRFEETIGEAIALNTALMILIDKDQFRDFHHELLMQISRSLSEAKKQVHKGYDVMRGT